MNGVMRLDAGANVGHADQNIPCALRDGAGQARRVASIRPTVSRDLLPPLQQRSQRGRAIQDRGRCAVPFRCKKGDGDALSARGH